MRIRFVTTDGAFVLIFLEYTRPVERRITIRAFNRGLHYFSACLAYIIRTQNITSLLL